MSKLNYNPDVLSCLANLSNDEVFTPPGLANQMLDMLPQELFCSPDTKFLDPCTKSGVFLREIAKRLIEGLADKMPDLQERIDHIMHHQLYGLSITRLTSLMSRRSLYCSKDASGKYSISQFDNEDGNIRFSEIKHSWKNGKCRYCGASQDVYDRGNDLESHAYEFIHTDNPKTLFKNMTFDVIIGNPPYQLEVGIEKDNYSIPLYHKFVDMAMKLNPQYVSMVIPARWFAGGRGLDDFRDKMLNDNRISNLVDYPNAVDCFPGVDISGGVCYFLWNRNYKGECSVKTIRSGQPLSTIKRPLLEEGCSSFIRFNEAIPIIRKVRKKKEQTFDILVSSQTPFGLVSSFKAYKQKKFPGSVILHTVNGIGYIQREQIIRNSSFVDDYKVYISKSYGERGEYPYRFLAKPFLGEQNSCCTQTYLVIGPFSTKIKAENVISYIHTKFFRFCIMMKKNTQDAMRGVYQFVPLQDFSKPWTDEELYAKYGLTNEEIQFIESMIRPME